MPLSRRAGEGMSDGESRLRGVLTVLSGLALTVCGCGGGTSSGNANVPVSPTITSVSVSCSQLSILTTQTSTCAATVQGTGAYSSAVTWAASGGTVTTSGVFTPTSTGTASVTATSTQDVTKSGHASITVTSPPANNEWTWESGSIETQNTQAYFGGSRYGTQGIAATTNFPGARQNAVSWIDGSGNLWLFGGSGFDSNNNQGNLNDLWEFNPTAGTWTWISGSNTVNAVGVYGTQGVAAPSSIPGGRYWSTSWIDLSGDFWIFGGDNSSGILNDLWEFNPSTKEWTWVSGSNVANASSVYGTLETAAATNVPGARAGSVSWTDSSGKLWLFGGSGNTATANGYLNDLWQFDPTIKEWTWMSGSSTVNSSGVYGSEGVPAANNVPGGRLSAVGWIDGSGNFWLFGGKPYDNVMPNSFLNDLWEFDPTTKEWTWVSGSNAPNQAAGVYGTQGVAASTNVPASRWGSVSWIGSGGNLWLFGGQGYDSTTLPNGSTGGGFLNDLWEFSPTTKEWTWVSGSNVANAVGVYVTGSASNMPGARGFAVSWKDGSGDLWLFGGAYYYAPSSAGTGWVNDLWQYQP